MSTSMRPCWKCDYLLPANASRSRCPECGQDNDFAALDADVEAAFGSPTRALFHGRVFCRTLLRKAWRASARNSVQTRRWAIVALLAGLLIPAAMFTTTAAITLKTTVQCTPYPVNEINGQPICASYHRPPFGETNWFDWRGWRLHGEQDDKWGHMAILPWERIDRTLVSRSLGLSDIWTYPRGVISDLGLIAFTIASWWVLAAVWMKLARRRLRTQLHHGVDEIVHPDLKQFCQLVLASSGLMFTFLILIDLIVRFIVPDIGIAGGGRQWYSVRSYLPWSIALPAVLLWWISATGPPGISRRALWPAVAVGSLITFVGSAFRQLAPRGRVVQNLN